METEPAPDPLSAPPGPTPSTEALNEAAAARRSRAVAGAVVMGVVGPLLGGLLVVIQVIVVRWNAADRAAMLDVFAQPGAMLLSLVLSAVGALLIVAAPRGFRWRNMVERYAIRWPALSPLSYALMTAGSLLVVLGAGSLGSALVKLHVLPDVPMSGDMLNMLRAMERAPWPLFFAIGLAHALGPGITEELMFRGHVQRGLRASLSPFTAIAIASAMFALWHGHPVRIVLAFGGGCWLGWIAWRCDATGPGMVVHALTNFLYFTGSTLYRRLRHLPLPTHGRWSLTTSVLILAGCVLGIIIVTRWLSRLLPPAPDRGNEAAIAG